MGFLKAYALTPHEVAKITFDACLGHILSEKTDSMTVLLRVDHVSNCKTVAGVATTWIAARCVDIGSWMLDDSNNLNSCWIQLNPYRKNPRSGQPS